MLRGPPFIRAFIAMCASGVLLSSLATGVIHIPVASSSARREKSLFPAALFPFCAGVPAMGVGHAMSDDEDPEPFMRRTDFSRRE